MEIQIYRGDRTAAEFIRQKTGFPISDRGLQSHRFRGTGPVHQNFGRAVFYKKHDLLAWAAAMLSGHGLSDAKTPNQHGLSDRSSAAA
jgi:hypothetical protein